jgi:hypothetical protein
VLRRVREVDGSSERRLTWIDRRSRGLWLVAISIALAVGTACGADRTAPTQGPSRTGTVADEPAAVPELASIRTLQDRFEEDAGRVRLILLISPT